MQTRLRALLFQMNSRDILSSAMLDIGAHVLLALKEAAGRDPVPPGSETATPSDWGSLAWARGSELQATSDRRACLDAATGDLYLAPLLWAVKKAFNAPGSETYINLPRFETLRALLVDEVVPELYRAAMLPVGEYAARAAAALVDASYALAATPEDSYRALEKGLTGCIIRHLVDLVDNKLALGAGLPGDFRLKEDTWHAQRRVELNEQLVKLREAKKKIDRIQLQ